ncbi:hypothetical protein HPB48_021410 [Haemaphysalis longicornis]|uniref:Uncharacterized protein n=1 Tax=Haemaphysalis longicornis TaxID=44386 RepID=A0A9J6FQP2_HAELO|nr:hypothetical protein HPB48_021410 [Haemaphysalis longicornis]
MWGAWWSSSAATCATSSSTRAATILRKFVCSDQLTFPNGVVVNQEEEKIFISDNLAHCVKVFIYTGAHLRQIGGEGVTNFPVAVCLIGTWGICWLANNHRGFNVTVFTQEGRS